MAHSDERRADGDDPTGSRFQMNSATIAPRTANVMAMSLMAASGADDGVAGRVTAPAGPHGMPRRYQTTKNTVQTSGEREKYGSISAMIVPMPAPFS